MTWLLWSEDLGWVSHQSLEPLAIYSVIDSNIQFKNTADIVLNGNLVPRLTSVHQKREMWWEREKATAEEKQPKEIQGNDTECTRSEFMCRQAMFLIQMHVYE